MFGNLAQTFTRTAGGVTGTNGFKYDAMGVPTMDLEIGLAYVPTWPCRNSRITVGYRYEQWFSWAESNDSTVSIYFSGIVARAEYKF